MIRYLTLALMLASLLFAEPEQRPDFRPQAPALATTPAVETIAAQIALERLDEIGALAFDQRTRDRRVVTDVAELTPVTGFGDGKDRPGDDMDDFHDTVEPTFETVGEQTLSFATHVTVAYADEHAPDRAVAHRTRYKRVTVTVIPVPDQGQLFGADALYQEEVTVARTYACESACQW